MAVTKFIFLFLFFVKVKCEVFTAEDNARMPLLKDLDDYDRCLSQEYGLYCLGDFELFPYKSSQVYDLMKSYSSDPYAFNRSLLYRGYCVSARCPKFSERNQTLRFERCVNERAKQWDLSARLRQLHYCTTRAEHKEKLTQPPEFAQQLFLQIVYALLVLNLVGTAYDIATDESKEKNALLMAWSVRANYRKLTTIYDRGDPRIRDLEHLVGLRVCVTLLIVLAHSYFMHQRYYVTNTEFLENVYYNLYVLYLKNNVSSILMFVVMSSFVTAYSILLYSKENKLSFVMLPVLAIKRIIRTGPVHLFWVGYTATWWPYARSGALSALLAKESATCRRKFWTHAFFVNNIMNKDDSCLMPTWYIPVDFHLFLLTCIFTIIMYRRRQLAMRFYLASAVISAVFSGVICYFSEWCSHLIFFISPKASERIVQGRGSLALQGQAPCTVGTEPLIILLVLIPIGPTLVPMSVGPIIHLVFRGISSTRYGVSLLSAVNNFTKIGFVKHYYFSTWSKLSPCFVGLFTAHLHYELQERKYNYNTNKFLNYMFYLSFALSILWSQFSYNIRNYKHPIIMSAYLTFEKLFFNCIIFFIVIGLVNIDGPLRRFFGWRGWLLWSRLSLSVMLSHWLILTVICARPAAYETSHLTIMSDCVVSILYSHLVSIPVTLLLEIPIQKTLSQFI